MKPVVENHLTIDNTKTEQKRIYTDICLSPEYVELYEEKEEGEAITYLFKCEYGEIEHTYIKRKIPVQINGETYYDITSAYGYGGPIVRKSTDTKKLFKQYHAAFKDDCRKNRIVSGFYRFHVIECKEAIDCFEGQLDYIGPNVVRALTVPLKENMHKSVGTSVRQARKKGLQIKFDASDGALSEFMEIYNETMNRNQALDYYYFDHSFFRNLNQKLVGHYVFSQAILDGKVIGSYLTLLGSDIAFGFLGGTLTDYLSFNASTFLEFETIKWLKEKGYQYYILGGGQNGEDSLFRYKRKFDKKGLYPYYVGKEIYNQTVYDQLVEASGQSNTKSEDENYFPAYRR